MFIQVISSFAPTDALRNLSILRAVSFALLVVFIFIANGFCFSKVNTPFFVVFKIGVVWFLFEIAMNLNSLMEYNLEYWKDLIYVPIVYFIAGQKESINFNFYNKYLFAAVAFYFIRPFLSGAPLVLDLFSGSSSWKEGAFLCALSLVLFVQNKHRINIMLTILFFSLIILTAKRTSWVAISIFYLISIAPPTIKGLMDRYSRGLSALMIVAWIAVSVESIYLIDMIESFIPTSGRDRILSFLYSLIEDRSFNTWVFGSGPGFVERASVALDTTFRLPHAHNDVLNVLLDYGVIGLMFWFAIVFKTTCAIPVKFRMQFLSLFLIVGLTEQAFFNFSFLLIYATLASILFQYDQFMQVSS